MHRENGSAQRLRRQDGPEPRYDGAERSGGTELGSGRGGTDLALPIECLRSSGQWGRARAGGEPERLGDE